MYFRTNGHISFANEKWEVTHSFACWHPGFEAGRCFAFAFSSCHKIKFSGFLYVKSDGGGHMVLLGFRKVNHFYGL